MATISGTVRAANTANLSAGTSGTDLSQGRQGEMLTSHVHGKWYQAALAGNLFCAFTLIAGVALPVAAATLNSKFTIHNPAGSGKNVELVSFAMGIDSATTVVNGIGVAIQRNLSGTSGIPTTTTTITSAQLGPQGGLGQSGAVVYSQATLTNVAIPGVTAATAVPIPFYQMFSFGAVTAAGIFPASHEFDGRVILGPDSLGAFCTTVAAATAAFCGIVWAEWNTAL